MLIGGTHTCPGAPELQAKESLSEEGWLGPQQSGLTKVRGRRVQSWGRDLDGTCQDQGRQGRSRKLGGREPASPLDPHGFSFWAWGFPDSGLSRGVGGSGMGMGSQSGPWGPHRETVTPLGKETALSSGSRQASREGRSGSHRMGKGALSLGCGLDQPAAGHVGDS